MENKINLNPEAIQRVQELQQHLEDLDGYEGKKGMLSRIGRGTKAVVSSMTAGVKLLALIAAGVAGASLADCKSPDEYKKPAISGEAVPGGQGPDPDLKLKKSALEMADIPNFTAPVAVEWDQSEYEYDPSAFTTGEVEGRRVIIFSMDDGTGWKTYYVDSDASTPEECFAQGVTPKLLEGLSGSACEIAIYDGEIYFAYGTDDIQVGTLTFQGASGDLEVTNSEVWVLGFGANYLNVIVEEGIPYLYYDTGKANLITKEFFPIGLDCSCGVPDAGANGVCVLPFQVNGDECWIAMKPTIESPDTDIQFATTLNQGSTQNLSPHLIEVDGKTLVVFMKQIGGRLVPVYSEVLEYCGDGECNGDETSDTCAEDCPVVDPDPDQTDVDAGSTDTAEPSGDIDAGSTDTDTYDPDAEPDGGPDTEEVDGGEDIEQDIEPDVEPDLESDTSPDIEPDTADTGEDTEPDTSLDTEPDTTPDIESDASPDVDPDINPDTTIPPECTDNPSHVEAEMPVTSCPIEPDGVQLDIFGEGEITIHDPSNPDAEPITLLINRSEYNSGGSFKVTCFQYPGYSADCAADQNGIEIEIVEDGDGYKGQINGHGVTMASEASNYTFNNVGERTVNDNGVEKTLTVVHVASYNAPNEPLAEIWNEDEGWYAQVPSDGITYRINAETGESAIDEPENPETETDVSESDSYSESDVSGEEVDSTETETGGGGGGGGCQSCNSTNEKTNPNAIPLVVMTAVLALLYRKNRQKMQETSPRITGELIARKTREALASIFSRSR